MKARATVVTLALCFVGVAACFAADSFMGTWKLNEAKSKIGAGSPKKHHGCLRGRRRRRESHGGWHRRRR